MSKQRMRRLTPGSSRRRMDWMLGLILSICAAACTPNPPNEQQVRRNFQVHKLDYIRLASLIRKNPPTHLIDADGDGDVHGSRHLRVPLYRELLHKVGVKEVIVREDGSIEFELGGHGCAICSDSYTGVFYYPADAGISLRRTQSEVASLDKSTLPKENGKVASGLYTVLIESDWYAYRYEYQE